MIATVVSGEWHGIPKGWVLVAAITALGLLFGGLNALTNRKYVFEDGLVSGVVGRMGSGKSLFIVSRVLLPFCRALSRKGYLMSSTERPVVRVVANFRFDPGMPNVEVRTVMPSETEGVFTALRRLAEQIGDVEGPWRDAEGVLHNGRNARGIRELPEGCKREPILNALVVLDEMHLFAGSSKLALSDDTSYVISMARKYNCELWWASQHEMKVHKRLRDESSVLWLAGKVSGFLGFFVGERRHVARCFVSAAQVEKARAGTPNPPRSIERRFYRYTPKVGRFFNSFELLVPDPSRRSDATGSLLERQRRRLELAPDPVEVEEVS